MASTRKKAVPVSSRATGRRKTGGAKKAGARRARAAASAKKKASAQKVKAKKAKAPKKATGARKAKVVAGAKKKATLKKAARKTAPKKSGAKKKAVKKKTAARKKAVPAKKTAVKKKATAKKKSTARKASARKAKAGTSKKSAAQKKVARKATTRAGTTKKGASKKGTAKKATAKKATAKKSASRKVPARKAPSRTQTARGRKSPVRSPRGRRRAVPGAPPGAIPGLNEEDQIRSAKYLPRDLPKRLFEEDRFMFPESYGVNRVRLLVRDPDWVFAYWDVSPETMKGLAKSLGERALALSRLTLRVLDPVSGGMSDILLPPGSRWWYIRTDAARRTYRAEIGITLPSGEFRQLAESNAVVTPRVGPSRERAKRQLSYRGAGELPPEEAEAAGRAERETGLAKEPWTGDADTGERGGASDAFRPAGGGQGDRPGASDAFRPGASDTFRR